MRYIDLIYCNSNQNNFLILDIDQFRSESDEILRHFIQNGDFFLIKNNNLNIFKEDFFIKYDQFTIINFINQENSCEVYASIYNKDGSSAKMCGNLIRSLAHLTYQKYNKDKVLVHFYGNENIFQSQVNIQSQVHTKQNQRYIKHNIQTCGDNFSAIIETSATIPTKISIENINNKITLENDIEQVFYVNLGNKHVVSIVKNLKILQNINLLEKIILNLKQNAYKDANFSFIYMENNQIINNQIVFVKVFENGVGWTKSCGSAAIAIYKALQYLDLCAQYQELKIQMDGGIINIKDNIFSDTSQNHSKDMHNLTMTGISQIIATIKLNLYFI